MSSSYGLALIFVLFVLPSMRKNMPKAKTGRGKKIQEAALIATTFVLIGLGAVGSQVVWPIFIIIPIVAACVYLNYRWGKHARIENTGS